MSERTYAGLPADATAEQIEANIAATRARLSESVDALADKVDVKAQAQRKVADAKGQAAEKVNLVKTQAGAMAGQTRQQLVTTSQGLLELFTTASRPIQIAVGSTPVAMLIVMFVRRARR